MSPGDDLDSGDFDPPRPPPGLSPVERHTFDMQAWYARAIIAETKRASRRASEERVAGEGAAERRTSQVVSELRELRRAVQDVDSAVEDAAKAPPGPVSRLASWVSSLPMLVQVAVALAGVQLVGAVYERLTGHAPPQVTVPASVSSVVQTTDAAPK